MSEDQIRPAGVRRHRTYYNDDTGETTEQERHDDLPEDLMAKIEDYYGSGEGRVSVGGALGSSIQFHKCEAFVSISANCDNDLDAAEEVHNILQPKVGELIAEDLTAMSKLRDPWLAPGDRLHGKTKSPPGRVKSPPKKGPTSLPPAEGEVKNKPPKRSASIKNKKGVKKPSFRR